MASNKSLTREQVESLYKDLAKTMKTLKGAPIPEGKKSSANPSLIAAAAKPQPAGDNADLVKELVKGVRASFKADDAKAQRGGSTRPASPASAYGMRPPASSSSFAPRKESAEIEIPTAGFSRGTTLAFFVTGVLLCAKIGVAALELSGVFSVAPVEASVVAMSNKGTLSQTMLGGESQGLLTELDSRRANLETYRKTLDQREREITRKDTEVESKLHELRQLTDQIRGFRSDASLKKTQQLDQLANVYSAMLPNEAAQLMEQLEVDISLSLLKRMPEKRIGQILALMNKDRALSLTKMLSGISK